ncbi:TonB-dependent receptor [Candidatus Latescibacterota bacterium]
MLRRAENGMFKKSIRTMMSEKNRLLVIYLFIALFCVYPHSCPIADEMSIPAFTVADMLPGNAGISILRYGSFGLGAYPYSYTLPMAGLKVFIDGVPLKSFSPFGPDLELIPFIYADSLEYRSTWVHGGMRALNINTKAVTEDKLLTTTRFLLGSRRRFNYNASFRRKLGKNSDTSTSSVFFSGSSNGIHGSEDTEENSARNYFARYQRFLENNGIVHFSLHTFRDRDGLVDLDRRSHMGQRKTDNIAVSIGFNEYPIGTKTNVSSTLYYNSVNSRFDRYGFRKSLDDNSAGLHVAVSTKRGNTNYGFNASHDTQYFDSRIHDDFWSRSTTDVSTSFLWKNDRFRVMLNGGLLNSTKYGNGTKIEGKLTLLTENEQELVLRGFITDEFPDTGKEYYTSLVFSDTTIVYDLDKYTISEIEIGVHLKKNYCSIGLFGFGSSSKLPLFMPSTAVMSVPRNNTAKNETEPVAGQEPFSSRYYMSPERGVFGYRIYFNARFGERLRCDIMSNWSQRTASIRRKRHDNGAYPSCEFFSDVRLSRKFFNERLTSIVFGSARLNRWNDDYTNPFGNYFLLDSGLSIQVSTLELFYKIENITNENIRWFNTLGWQGRNSMWGLQWKFYN